MKILETRSTERFVTTPNGDAQLLQVALDEPDPSTKVTVTVGDALIGSALAASTRVEVPLTGLVGRSAGETYEAVVQAGDLTTRTQIVVAEPGWTVWMIPHFHYDPVWWNTQAAYTATWDDLGGQAQQFRQAFQQTGFALVDAHLQAARLYPDYKFVLAEVDYLKPYWDARPAQRAYLRRLIAEGRLEIMGGTYNEPNTNLTTAETTIRNLVYGSGFQRDVLGADPQTAWQLDVFGHDPQFPGLAADAGLSSSSWARGPHHQWGPMLTQHGFDRAWADPSVMQFPAEFEWIAPSGRGVLTHYMPAHYSAGWRIDSCTTLADAEDAVYELFLLLKRVAATRNILLPVGTDYTPPSKWVTEIQRDWNARYSWPRFECAIPRQFFAAVRRELEAADVGLSPQTRDMNPVYTGKDVSYIDTKQAQRIAEGLLIDAEMFATFAALRGSSYPHAALDRAWRRLVFGAQHDGITGSESDQVYLDLLTGWREAHDIGGAVLSAALDHLTGQLEVPALDGTSVTVFNPSVWDRVDLVSVEVRPPHGARGLQVVGPDGQPAPSVVDHPLAGPDGTLTAARVTFLADAPAVGHRAAWRVQPTATATPGWTPSAGTSIESDRYLITVDPERGGCVSRLFDKRAKREAIRPADVGNEIVIAQEYSEHPQYHEGPWNLLPNGETVGRSAANPADAVVVETSALGQRITVRGRLGTIDYSQQITLWDGVDRIACRTTLDGFDGADQLVRLRWAVDIPGALPVSDVSCAVVGRGYAFADTDVVDHPWTLDNPAVNWFALSSTARVRISTDDRDASHERAIGIAELVASDRATAEGLRGLAVALAGQGVTATTSVASGARYGNLATDSNLPDVRIAVGGPEENAFTAAVLDDADEQYRIELDKRVSTDGRARIWVPGRRPLREVWQPSANLTGTRDLPVLIIVGDQETDAVIADLSDAVIEVRHLSAQVAPGEPTLDDYTVALINSGMPSFNVDTSGALCMSVLRSCTGWPSGVWINPPRRTAPDGSNFQQQHWTHHFDYSVVAGPGDWRQNTLVSAGHEFNHPLRTSQAVPAGQDHPSNSYLTIDSAADVLLTAVKPSGNPLACGRSPGPVESLIIRVAEANGATTQCSVEWPLASGPAVPLDVLERAIEDPTLRTTTGTLTADLSPMQVRTLQLPVHSVRDTDVPQAEADPDSPVYTRYWLNNAGPAPRGGLPITVHSEPSLVEWSAGTDIELKVVVSSDRTDHAMDVPVHAVVPRGWHANPSEFPTRVPPGGFTEQTVRVTSAAEPAPGIWWVRVQAVSNGQAIEDVTRIVVGNGANPEVSAELTGPTPLMPGQSGEMTLNLANSSHSHISTQIELISPWHTWELLPDWNTRAELPPLGTATLSLPVHVPTSAAPGFWWVLAKVATAGVLHYTEPVELVVRRP